MARIVKFPISTSVKLGFKKARRRKKVNLEDFGQLNLFNSQAKEAKVISISIQENPFEKATEWDEAGNLTKAKEYYQRAIQKGESVADAFCNLGVIQSEEQAYSAAIDSFTRCLKEDPRHFEAHYNLGNVYSEIGNLSLAKVHYELCTAIEPGFASAYYNLGLSLALADDYEAAIIALQKYTQLTHESEHDSANKLIKSLQETLLNKAQ